MTLDDALRRARQLLLSTACPPSWLVDPDTGKLSRAALRLSLKLAAELKRAFEEGKGAGDDDAGRAS